MKLSKVLRAIGTGATIAAQFTPAGAAVTKGLDMAGNALHRPDGVEDDEPDTLREIAVQTVLANAGVILAATIAAGKVNFMDAQLRYSTDAVEEWLQYEARGAAEAEKAGTDGR
jgi:hypothetical protein